MNIHGLLIGLVVDKISIIFSSFSIQNIYFFRLPKFGVVVVNISPVLKRKQNNFRRKKRISITFIFLLKEYSIYSEKDVQFLCCKYFLSIFFYLI